MTDAELAQAERDALAAAALFLPLLLLGPGVEFRADVGRFYVDGKSVSVAAMRDYTIRIERELGKRLTALSTQLEAGEITVAQWQAEFERNIATAHVLMAALALGGIKAALANDEVRRRIDAELKYARNFARQIRDDDAGSPKQIAARSKSYLLGAAITFGILLQRARALIGVQTECRRVRRASESCPGCVSYAYRWMPINVMPPIGSLQCGHRCRCFLEFR
jgi:hypothetical protein